MRGAIDRIEFQGDVWPWSLGVMLSTWCKWSHVVMHTDHGSIIDANPVHGTSEREPNKSLTRWSRTYDLTPLNRIARESMYERATILYGSPYDWGWIAGYPFNQRDWQDPSNWVCFELVAYVIQPFLGSPKALPRITGRQLDRHLARLNLPWSES